MDAWELLHDEDHAWAHLTEEDLMAYLKDAFDGRFSDIRCRRNGDFIDVHIRLWDTPG